MNLTKHAKTRSRQRGFNPTLLDIISNFGRQEPAIDGATKITLGKRESQQIISEVKKLIQMLDKVNYATMIIKDGRVLTMYKHH